MGQLALEILVTLRAEAGVGGLASGFKGPGQSPGRYQYSPHLNPPGPEIMVLGSRLKGSEFAAHPNGPLPQLWPKPPKPPRPVSPLFVSPPRAGPGQPQCPGGQQSALHVALLMRSGFF